MSNVDYRPRLTVDVSEECMASIRKNLVMKQCEALRCLLEAFAEQLEKNPVGINLALTMNELDIRGLLNGK